MYIIGLTGGIACGKSAVAYELAQFGAKVLDVDKITHDLLKCGGELYNAYVQRYGDVILDVDGQLNRKIIADIIFNNDAERSWVNSVAHPVILNRVRDFLVECADNGEKLVVLEIPLLFEVGWEFLVDEVWAVYVNKSKQHYRLMQRDGISWEEADRRISAQLPAKEIAARADFVINNNHKSNVVRKTIIAAANRLFPNL